MKKYLLIPSLVFLLTACTTNSFEKTGLVETPVDCSISLEEAKAFANKAVENEIEDWGEIESIEYDDNKQAYEVYYPTSEGEAALLGERGVDVNCITGEISFQPRE